MPCAAFPWASDEAGCCEGRGRLPCLLEWCGAGMRPWGGPEGGMGRPDVLGILLGPLLAVLPNRLLDELG